MIPNLRFPNRLSLTICLLFSKSITFLFGDLWAGVLEKTSGSADWVLGVTDEKGDDIDPEVWVLLLDDDKNLSILNRKIDNA